MYCRLRRQSWGYGFDSHCVLPLHVIHDRRRAVDWWRNVTSPAAVPIWSRTSRTASISFPLAVCCVAGGSTGDNTDSCCLSGRKCVIQLKKDGENLKQTSTVLLLIKLYSAVVRWIIQTCKMSTLEKISDQCICSENGSGWSKQRTLCYREQSLWWPPRFQDGSLKWHDQMYQK